MPESTTPRRPDRPTEGFGTARLGGHPDRPVRLFLPADYQPKYAYPLIVLLHPDGADEDAAALLAPRLSRRNFIAACPRGPVALGTGPTGRARFGWLPTPADDFLGRVVAHARRTYSVHPDRVYLLGVGAGAAAAFRFGLRASSGVAGVVALNGEPPTRVGPAAGRTRVFVGHGAGNPVVPASAARRGARLLTCAGVDVRFQTYQTTHHVPDDMLRDVNRWIMGAVSADQDSGEWIAGSGQ